MIQNNKINKQYFKMQNNIYKRSERAKEKFLYKITFALYK